MAVVNIAGKNYLVKPGGEIVVNHLKLAEGEKLEVKDSVDGRKLEFEVIGHEKGVKIRVFKFRNKTRYKKTIGYRDSLTRVKLLGAKKVEKVEKAEKTEAKPEVKAKKTKKQEE